MKQPEYVLPKFRKGAAVEVITTGVHTVVEKIHYEPDYGNFYYLRDTKGVFAEYELRKCLQRCS